mmetsp:Transcript_38440/g.62217  ORF Transcript_38440/g.62217 Transcript_38440/m.62217 type:complete len:428 (+) Transcript_38440:303-1586(+)
MNANANTKSLFTCTLNANKRMKLTSIVLCLLLPHASGMVGNKAFEERRRALRNSFVPDSYVATVRGSTLAECESLRKWVESLQPKQKLATKRRRHRARNALIKKRCFVPFNGDAGLLKSVQDSGKVEAVTQTKYYHIQQAPPLSWALDRIDQQSLPLDKLPFNTSHTGAGVTIYILDTGVRTTHQEFGNRTSNGESFVAEEDFTSDYHGHGTHCAGIAAGQTYGVARNANVVPVKVLNAAGEGETGGVIAGIAWAVEDAKKRNVSGVISMSLGGPADDALDLAVQDAADAGLFVVVAAGNDYKNCKNFSPARLGGVESKVFTVGATTSTDAMSSFSNFGRNVDIFAPGSSIRSAWANSDTGTNILSGTSMATPFVAGVAATLLEKNNYQVDRAREELRKIGVKSRVHGLEDWHESPNLLVQTARGIK